MKEPVLANQSIVSAVAHGGRGFLMRLHGIGTRRSKRRLLVAIWRHRPRDNATIG